MGNPKWVTHTPTITFHSLTGNANMNAHVTATDVANIGAGKCVPMCWP